MKVDIYIAILIIIALSSFLLGIHGENCNPGYGFDTGIRSSGSCDNYITTEEECRKASVINQPYDNNNGYDGSWGSSYAPRGCYVNTYNDKYYFHDVTNTYHFLLMMFHYYCKYFDYLLNCYLYRYVYDAMIYMSMDNDQ